jgi:membrane-bound ClpP family serine protease
LEGCTGTAETPLRPIGTVRVNGERRDALSELGVIEVGTIIVVVEDRDNQLKVRAADAHEEEVT